MKRILMTLAVLALTAATSLAADLAQLKARIPFDFAAGNTQVAAGIYVVERLGAPGVMVLKDAAGYVKTTFQVNPVYSLKKTQQASLVFKKYGDRYFLHRIWVAGETAGQEVRKHKIERELIASAPAEQVIVAAIYR